VHCALVKLLVKQSPQLSLAHKVTQPSNNAATSVLTPTVSRAGLRGLNEEMNAKMRCLELRLRLASPKFVLSYVK
jgi:hypothetical protein